MRHRASQILVVDNYDSFTHNVVDQLTQLGARVEVRRNDAVDTGAAEAFDGIVLSPGPGRPADAGVCLDLLRGLGERMPFLGICLGHQAIAQAYGGRIVRAVRPLHGQATPILNRRRGVLLGLPARFEAARYHSLVIDPRRPGRGLEVTARSEEGEIMAVRHRRHPVEGIQFHPESHLTPWGPHILAAFLVRTGMRPRDAAHVRR